MTGFFISNSKRLKKLHRAFTWFAIFSLILQLGSGVFLYQPALAEETTPPETPAEEIVEEPVEEPTATEETSVEPTEETPAEPVDEISLEEPVEESTEEVQPEPVEEPILTVEQEEIVEEAPEETVVEEETTEPETDLEESVVAEESAELNPSISTDKADYAPEETVKITGENFPVNTTLIIKITRPDGSVVKGDGSFEPGSDEITTDAEGKFEYHYQLDGIEGDYLVEVLLGGTILATTTFTDASVSGCTNDVAGPDDEAGQKDLSKMCVDYANLPSSISVLWNWDDTAWPGGNTGDACSLYDTNENGLADYSLCVIVEGNPAVYAATVLYSCGDESAYKCTQPTTEIPSPASVCDAAVQAGIDPFSSDPAHTGNVCKQTTGCLSDDTVANCLVEMSDVGGVGVAELIDVCSYPSSEPNSDPSDCIIYIPRKGKLEVVKDLDPDSDSGLFNLYIDGVVTVNDAGEGGTTGEQVVDPGTYDVGETGGTNTDLNNYSTSIECRDQNGSGSIVASGSGAGPLSVNVNQDDDIVCTVTNSLQLGTLTLIKTVSGGTATESDFQAYIDGNPVPWGVAQSLLSGSHAASEIANVSGYTASEWTGACAANGDVTLNPGDDLTCYITNTRDTGTITILKNIDWDESGTIGDHPNDISGATDWTWDIDGLGDYPTGSTQTVTTGSYTISEDQKPNYHVVNLTCDGTDYGNTESQEVTIGYNEDLICTFVNAPDLGSISGVKFNDLDGDGDAREGGEPGLPNWTIEVKDLSGAVVGSDITGADGSYSVGNLVPGIYSVCEVTQAGWTRTHPDADCYYGVLVGPGGTVTDKDFGNFKNVDITVCKYIDTDGDGTGDTPYTDGWQMTLNPGDISQTTDGTGCTTFSNLGPGSYSVTEEIKPGWTPTGPTTHDFGQVESGNQSYTWTFGNFQNVSVTACKLVDSDGDINTTGDQGVKSDWTVYLSIDGVRQTPGEQTGETGCYTWTNLGPGHSYDVEEDVPAGWTALTPTSHDFGPAQSGSEAYTYNFINFKNVTITVCKYNDVDGSGNVSAPDMPLSGWEMTLYKDWQLFESQFTGGDGCYVWNNMGPGFYRVEEEVKDGWINTVPTFWNFGPVQSGGNYRRDFTNRGGLKICGTKYEDMDGSGDYSAGDLPYTDGWQISIYSAHMGADVTSTDANGEYCFENLEPGDFTVTEEDKAGWVHTSSASVPVTLTDHDETVDFFNFKCVTIWGYKWQDKNIGADGSGRGVKDSEDDFLDGWEIQLHQGSVPGNIVDTALSGEGCAPAGYYGFYNICQPGTYLIKEVNQNGYTQTHPGSQGQDAYYMVEVTSGTVTPIGSIIPESDGLGFDFANFKNIKISGYKFEDVDGDGIWDPGEPSIQGWQINLSGSMVTARNTDINGYYEFDNLKPGIYHVGEQSKAGWVQTSTPTVYDFYWPAVDQENVNFGNFEHAVLSGYKVEDVDGDGDPVESMSEPRLDGWTINLEKQGEGIVDSAVTGDGVWADGYYEFIITSPGTYTLTEVPQAGWYETYPNGIVTYTYPVSSGTKIATINFLNARYGSIGDFVWEDLNNDTFQDAGEPGIGGVTVYLYLDDGDGTFEPGGDDGSPINTQITDGSGWYLFEDLVAGDYWVDIDDTTIPFGYILTTANDPMLVNLAPGGDELGADFGYFPQPPEISIAKENDKSGGASTGDIVNYTLTLTNGPIPLIVDVVDVLPEGFTYVAGSGEVNGVPTEPTVSGSTLSWADISFGPEDVVTITYQAKIDDSQPAGTYYNLATCRGSTGELFVRYSEEPLTANCDIVESSVPIGQGFYYSTSVGGKVLGEAILGAATGSPTILLIIALLMILSGIVFLNFEKIKKRLVKLGYKRLIKSLLIALGLLVFSFGVASAATSLVVKIAKLPDYINYDPFDIYYTALQAEGKPVEIKAFMNKDGQSKFEFGSSMETSGSFTVDGSLLSGDGKYYFLVKATSDGTTVQSEEESVIIDRNAPAPVSDYRKEKIGSKKYKICWKNPDEDDFKEVLIYRSDKTEFEANHTTQIAGVGGSKNDEKCFEDDVPEDKDYYYVTRVIDKAGNISGVIGDPEATTVTVIQEYVSPTPIALPIVSPLPIEEEVEEGEILGEEIPEVTPEPGVLGEARQTVAETVSGLGPWKTIALVIVGGGIIGLIAFFLKRR